ncbi:NADH:ubiquinone oxidoreductase [Pseudomonas cavernae]|uniref:NADH:ubiquinone oxidoreductase n=1 Tax=Pseudomonas cavernae TaxID=2320867 RepID=A0A385Z815_9PSED|nr:NADH:ubiquinone oxidoreductase [Pseudomonas cavernae]AYC34954.1 NADH:ubiquinone oxidoreductase [Pseudomonas cavernae]
MRYWFALLCSALPLLAHGEACVVHSQGDRLDVKVCQQNQSIPPQLFRDGFCQPQLKGQKVAVEFVAQCPGGSFGVCRNAQVSNQPYRQDIHYYGVSSDANYLKPYCERQSKGVWMAR